MHGAWGDSIGRNDGGLLPGPETIKEIDSHWKMSPDPDSPIHSSNVRSSPVHGRRKVNAIASPVRRDRGPRGGPGSRIGSREGANSSASTPLWGSQKGLTIQIGDEVQSPPRGCVSDLQMAVDWGQMASEDASPVEPPSILTSRSDQQAHWSAAPPSPGMAFAQMMNTNEEPSPLAADSPNAGRLESPGSGDIAEEIGVEASIGGAVQWRWKRGNMVGSGSYGRVYLGMNMDTGELLAVKQLEYMENVEEDREKVESLETEISIMKTLRHKNVCGYLGTERTEGDSPGAKFLNILLEYVPGGSISQLLCSFGAFGEKVIQLYTHQILEGLAYLHANKVAHRDVKGANILVTADGRVKLSDFGHSKRLESTLVTHNFQSLKGTAFWMAPEVIKQEGHGRRADIWSVGCTVVEMATGKPPWSELSNQLTAMFTIATSEEPPAIPDGLSQEAHLFIGQCFKRNPQERPTAVESLKHSFLHNCGHKSEVTAHPAYSTYRHADE